ARCGRRIRLARAASPDIACRRAPSRSWSMPAARAGRRGSREAIRCVRYAVPLGDSPGMSSKDAVTLTRFSHRRRLMLLLCFALAWRDAPPDTPSTKQHARPRRGDDAIPEQPRRTRRGRLVLADNQHAALGEGNAWKARLQTLPRPARKMVARLDLAGQLAQPRPAELLPLVAVVADAPPFRFV